MYVPVVTQKDIKNNFNYVLSVRYCLLQNLLQDLTPIGRTQRREGWGADIYKALQDVVIVTGYAPFGNVKPRVELCNQFNDAARKTTTPKARKSLIVQFVHKAITEYNNEQEQKRQHAEKKGDSKRA